MSKLNVYHHELRHNEYAEFYLKSEADKVIKELEECISDGDKDFEMANNQNERLLKIVRRHKYKRCLARAETCAEMKGKFVKLKWFDKATFWRKWQDKWLELAEKFKEVK